MATAWIVLAHLGLLFESGCVSPVYPEWVQPVLMAVGAVAVQFFFVLSGFVLTWTWSTGRSKFYFLKCRLARIYPSHVATAVLVAAMLIAAGWDWPGKRIALANIALVHTWWPEQRWLLSLNSPSWTLASELFLYFVLVSIIRRDGSVCWYRVVFFGALGVSWLFFGLGSALFAGVPMASRYLMPPSALVPFLAGVAIASLGRKDPEVICRLGRWKVFVYCLAFPVSLFAFVQLEWLMWLMLWLVTAWALAALVRIDIMQKTEVFPFCREPWRSMGRYSFAIYIGHMPIIIGVLIFAGGPAAEWSDGFVLVLATSLILPGMAWVLRNLVEQPVYRWLTGREPPLA
jgi:peptidoglycan/LPS O-acetylase OafA/YrhL